MRESAVTSHVRLTAAQENVLLWRNNCGGFYDERGRFVRYGLGSEHKLASADYIGITPVVITPDMVGTTIGVFTAVEMKETNWKYNPNNKHVADQKLFLDAVLKNGGYAGFATCVEEFKRIVKK